MGNLRKTITTDAPAKRAIRHSAAQGREAVPAAAAIDHDSIAVRAYELYVESGYQAGQELRHWLDAEAELRRRLTRS